MSLGSQLLNAGFSMLLDHHAVSIRHVPASGPVRTLSALDNGQPEDAMSLALPVEGLSRIVTITRGAATVAVNDSIWIEGTTYKVLGVRQRNEQATDILLGATVVAGRQ